MCIQYLSDKKSISKLPNSTILHFAVKVWPTAAITLQKYFFSLVQLTPYEYGFRGYLHFFCTIANKNTATTYVRPGGLCYKTREICHGDYLGDISSTSRLSTMSLTLSSQILEMSPLTLALSMTRCTPRSLPPISWQFRSMPSKSTLLWARMGKAKAADLWRVTWVAECMIAY